MEIYLIRHAHALEREDWQGEDIARPLSKEGIERAKKAFKRFAKIFKHPEVIISSQAVRAVETAKILQKYIDKEIIFNQEINPGSDTSGYLNIIESIKDKNIIAIVGHEPTISSFVSEYTSDNKLDLVFKKGSICHLSDRTLLNFIQQKCLL